MTTVQTIANLLGCSAATAEKIESTMYNWVSPDWSESSEEELRMDLMVAAECEGIEIVSA